MLRHFTGTRNRSSLQGLAEYRDQEESRINTSSVSDQGVLLEYETLELRIHPPNVDIDNDMFEDRTMITLDSANRPGTLVELVQCLTELGLNVCKARISSDGGWFIDQFEVTDNGCKVTNERKLKSIHRVLSPQSQKQSIEQDAEDRMVSTVFEMTGTDRTGLLSDVVSLIKNEGCAVQSAAVWTYASRVAFVVSVLERDQPVRDKAKLESLQQKLVTMLEEEGGSSIALISSVRGTVHYERRLHQLLLREEEASWKKSGMAERYEHLSDQEYVCFSSPNQLPSAPGSGASSPTSSGHSAYFASNGQHLGNGTPFHSSHPPQKSSSGNGTSTTGATVHTTNGHGHATVHTTNGHGHATVHTTNGHGHATHTLLPSGGLNGRPPPGPGTHAAVQGQAAAAAAASPPEVTVSYYKHRNYWLVMIRCRDRTKLLFDTVCTLADLKYDVYHACVDLEGTTCCQAFYVRPRYGDATWSVREAAKLAHCLERATIRRFPKGLKLRLTTHEGYDVGEVMAAFRQANLLITRARVCPLQSGQTFYLVDASTRSLPDLKTVQQACTAIGGRLLTTPPPPPAFAATDLSSKGGSRHLRSLSNGQQQAAALSALHSHPNGGAKGSSMEAGQGGTTAAAAADGLAAGARFGFKFITRPEELASSPASSL